MNKSTYKIDKTPQVMHRQDTTEVNTPQATPLKATKPRQKYGLKHTSKKILDIIASQETRNATQAYREVHPDASDITARVNSYKLLQKPESRIYLQEHISNARETIIDLMNNSSKDDIRLRSAIDVLDRSTGKAIQRTEVTTQGVTLNIDLTSSLNSDTTDTKK